MNFAEMMANDPAGYMEMALRVLGGAAAVSLAIAGMATGSSLLGPTLLLSSM